jgi:transcription antitermination protein NusB
MCWFFCTIKDCNKDTEPFGSDFFGGETVMSRRLVRELVIQRQYQQLVHPEDQGDIFAPNEAKLSGEDKSYYEIIRAGLAAHLDEIDPYIIRYVKSGWSLDRLSIVDRAVLRLAVYELLYQKDIPAKVVVNEAVDLAKAFSGEEAGRFVNGILGKIIAELEEPK